MYSHSHLRSLQTQRTSSTQREDAEHHETYLPVDDANSPNTHRGISRHTHSIREISYVSNNQNEISISSTKKMTTMIGVDNRAYKGATYQVLRFRSRLKGDCQNAHLGGLYGVFGDIREQAGPIHPFIGQHPPTHPTHAHNETKRKDLHH